MTSNACNWDDSWGMMARMRAFARKSRGAGASDSSVASCAEEGLPGRQPRGPQAALIPTVRYRDVAAAISWLGTAFGMQEHRVVADENGMPCYAELTFGGSLLMLARSEDTAFGRLMVQPDEIGGVETQVCYLFVEDAPGHYARARAAGAEIVLDIEDQDNGGRGYSCRDPEGHVWNFGTYNPWASQRTTPDTPSPRHDQQGVATLLLVALAAVLMFEITPQPQSANAGTDREQLALEQPRGEGADLSAKDLLERQAKVHGAALQAAQKIAAEARAEFAEARTAQEKAERAAAAVRVQLEEARSAKQAAERATTLAREAQRTAEKDTKDARAQAVEEQRRRVALEQRSQRTRRRVAAFRYFRPRLNPRCIGYIDSTCISSMSYQRPPDHTRALRLGV